MNKLIQFLIVFGVIFLIYLIFLVFNKKKLNKIFETKEALFLKSIFKIEFIKESKISFAVLISFVNSLIYAISYVILTLFKNVYIGFLIIIPTLIILIFLFYGVIGFVYKMKEGKKNV